MVKLICYISMNVKIISIKTDFITLGAFLKFTGQISQGAEAAIFLNENEVKVNEELENRRGRKIYPGYTVSINGDIFTVEVSKEG